jgi:hypothetical protein
MALADEGAGRGDLLPGKTTLRDGARIRNILDFAREDLDKPVAENTRESYRKQSLKPLQTAGIVGCYKTSVNDPNTHYVINGEFATIIDETDSTRKRSLIQDWMTNHAARLASVQAQVSSEGVDVAIAGEELVLSPGAHNELIKLIVETFAPKWIGNFEVLYIGDAANKMAYHKEARLRDLGVELNIHDKLPDVIFYDLSGNRFIVAESVTSVGPVSDARRVEVIEILERDNKLAKPPLFLTAFPDRVIFRRFVRDIAWDTYVWMSDEDGIVHFDKNGNATAGSYLA